MSGDAGDAADADDAVARVAALLGVDEVRVLVLLSRFSLLTLTRGAQAARSRTLAELRDEA